jgi:hypothetical protein
MEDSTATHEGTLSDAALNRAESGVVRKLHIPFSPVSADATKRLVDALKTEPCALLELDLRYATSTETSEAVFDGWTLDRVISPQPPVRTLACRRLRTLKLCACGVEGELPDGLRQCRALMVLDLQWNAFTGRLPTWLGELRSLRSLYLDSNHFQGPIPPSLGELARLKNLTLHDNKLDGVVPADALARLQNLNHVRFGSTPREWRDRWTDTYRAYRAKYGTLYEAGGNLDLTITAAGKAKLEALGERNNPGKGLEAPIWPTVVG